MGLRIAMVSTGFPRWRGDLFGIVAAELAETLVSQGDQVTVLAPAYPQVPRREEWAGVDIRRVAYFWPPALQKLSYGSGLVPNLAARPYLGGLLPTFLCSLALASAREARRADLFHGHWLATGLLGRATKAVHGKPVVVTLHGSDLALIKKLPFAVAKSMLGGFDCVTTVSGEMKETVSAYGIAGARLAVTPAGVNQRLFHPRPAAECRQRLGLSEKGPLLVWAGRIAPEKGLEDLISALPIIMGEHPSVRLVLLGEGALRERLLAQTRQAGVAEAVDFKGVLSRTELGWWYNAAELFVLPSLREGRPNSVLEAMACGRPVLASRVGGLPELIEDGLNGRLVPAGEPEALARAAIELLGRPDDLARMGANGPARLEELGLTWEKSAAVFRDVYHQVLADQEA